MTANRLLRRHISVECTSYGTPATAGTARGSWPNLREQVQHDRRYPHALRCASAGGGSLMPASAAGQAATRAAKWWLIDYMTEAGGTAAASLGIAAGIQAGFTEGQIGHARERAGVATKRDGFGRGARFIWTLDPSIPQGDRMPKAYAMACERPTYQFPGGRTGTRNGYAAHQKAGEQACRPCTEATSAESLARRRSLPPDELERYREGNAEASRRRRERVPGQMREQKHRYMATNREIIREAKSVPCTDCGAAYPYYVMQFDHLDAATKEFNIGVIGPTASRSRLLAEIAKCDVVCANCHAERTHSRRRAREAV